MELHCDVTRLELGEIDIRTQAILARAADELEQVCAFSLATSPADQYYQSGKTDPRGDRSSRECQEVVPIASDQNAVELPGIIEYRWVLRGDCKDFAKAFNVVVPMPKELVNLLRNIVIEEKFQLSASLICSATSPSISVR